MNTLQRLLSNTAFAFLSNLAIRAGNSILFIFIGRQLTPTDAGIFNLGITYFTILFGVSAWGLHELLVRELAPRRAEGKKYLANYLLLRVALAIITYLLLLAALLLFTPYNPFTQEIIFILALAVFPEAVFSICQALFEAYEQLFPPTAVSLVGTLLKLTVGLWFVFRGDSIRLVAWTVPISSGVSLLLFIPALIRLFRREGIGAANGRFDWQFSWDALRNTPNFFVIHIFSILDYQADAFLISLMLSEQHVGWYGAAQTLLLAFWMLPHAIRAAIYPIMARFYESNREKLATFYEEMTRFILAAILPAAAGIALLAEPIIQLVFKDAFDPAIPALRWSIWAVVFGMLNVPSARLLIIANRQREAAQITGMSMILNVVTNLLLIPRLGIVGAALARLISAVLFTTLIYIYAQRLVLRRSLLHLVWRPAVATGLMSLVVWQLRSMGLGTAVLGGIISYAILIFAVGGLSINDKLYLQSLLTKTNATS